MMASCIVSITRLKLNGPLSAPRFWWHALRSLAQARKAPGNVLVDARIVDGIHHTVTVWADKAAMRAYLTAGEHLQAMKAFRGIATGAVLGFEADAAPDWGKVHEIWRTRGRQV